MSEGYCYRGHTIKGICNMYGRNKKWFIFGLGNLHKPLNTAGIKTLRAAKAVVDKLWEVQS